MRYRLSISFMLIILLSVIGFQPLSGQNEEPSLPVSIRYPDLLLKAESIKLPPPDVATLLQEDNLSENNGDPNRMGVSLPLAINCAEDGRWVDVPGGKLWILKINSPGAKGLGLYFNKFKLAQGCTVHVFDPAVKQILGEFTDNSNPSGSFFASGIVPGSEIIIECFRPEEAAMPDIVIDEALYVYRSSGMPQVNTLKDFGGSGSCEVNINCAEGKAWQDEKHGVVRILIKMGSSFYWCTGSLVNNTRNDYLPYILTADHCAEHNGVYARTSDMAKWIFYFNFESVNCADPIFEPALHSTVGAKKIASASLDSGSDFFLALLNQNIPGEYLPFYNGWDRSGIANTGGVCIHHPEGDIKKISTYDTTLSTYRYDQIHPTHWEVYWRSTANGHGITEPGSSGAPLFDKTGHILGALTSGSSECSNLKGNDYFGKISYSWTSNGTADSSQLRPWLDPENTGALVIPGSFNNDLVVADFEADTISIPLGGQLNFRDRSLGHPTVWTWTFKGGDPATSNQQNPQGISYSKLGTYDVQLVASNNLTTDIIIRKKYVMVTPDVYVRFSLSPNPTRGIVYILAGNDKAAGKPVLVYNQIGQLVYSTHWPNDAGNVFTLDLTHLSGSVFFVSFYTSTGFKTSKILLLPQ